MITLEVTEHGKLRIVGQWNKETSFDVFLNGTERELAEFDWKSEQSLRAYLFAQSVTIDTLKNAHNSGLVVDIVDIKAHEVGALTDDSALFGAMSQEGLVGVWKHERYALEFLYDELNRRGEVILEWYPSYPEPQIGTVTTIETATKREYLDDHVLVTDEQECAELAREYNVDISDDDSNTRYSFFVCVGEGEYTSVWAYYGFVPYINKLVKKVG